MESPCRQVVVISFQAGIIDEPAWLNQLSLPVSRCCSGMARMHLAVFFKKNDLKSTGLESGSAPWVL
jgi:hypothetical protein